MTPRMTLSQVQVLWGPHRNLSTSSGQAPTRISAQQVDAQTLGQEQSLAGMRGRSRGGNLSPGRPVPKGHRCRVRATCGYPDD